MTFSTTHFFLFLIPPWWQEIISSVQVFFVGKNVISVASNHSHYPIWFHSPSVDTKSNDMLTIPSLHFKLYLILACITKNSKKKKSNRKPSSDEIVLISIVVKRINQINNIQWVKNHFFIDWHVKGTRHSSQFHKWHPKFEGLQQCSHWNRGLFRAATPIFERNKFLPFDFSNGKLFNRNISQNQFQKFKSLSGYLY